MKVNKSYEVTIWARGGSTKVSGKVIAVLSSNELRRYGKSSEELYASRHMQLPNGTPYSPESTPWYVIDTGSTEPDIIAEDWVKDNGITEIGNSSDMFIKASCKYDGDADTLRGILSKIGASDLVVIPLVSDAIGDAENLRYGHVYKVNVGGNEANEIVANYKGSISKDMLPSLKISPDDMLETYVSNPEPAHVYTGIWCIFELMDSESTVISLPKELVDEYSVEVSVNGEFSIELTGDRATVPHLRHVLTIAKCWEILITTTSG